MHWFEVQGSRFKVVCFRFYILDFRYKTLNCRIKQKQILHSVQDDRQLIVILSATKNLLLLDFDNGIFAIAQDDNLNASAWNLYCSDSPLNRVLNIEP